MIFVAFMLIVAILPYLLKVLAIVLKNLAIEFREFYPLPVFLNKNGYEAF